MLAVSILFLKNNDSNGQSFEIFVSIFPKKLLLNVSGMGRPVCSDIREHSDGGGINRNPNGFS